MLMLGCWRKYRFEAHNLAIKYLLDYRILNCGEMYSHHSRFFFVKAQLSVPFDDVTFFEMFRQARMSQERSAIDIILNPGARAT